MTQFVGMTPKKMFLKQLTFQMPETVKAYWEKVQNDIGFRMTLQKDFVEALEETVKSY